MSISPGKGEEASERVEKRFSEIIPKMSNFTCRCTGEIGLADLGKDIERKCDVI